MLMVCEVRLRMVKAGVAIMDDDEKQSIDVDL